MSEIGYGAWGIGGDMWLGAQDDESLAALHRAIDLGVNFIDTALAYGDGHSEQLVGQVVRERDERIVVASKIPPKNLRWPAPGRDRPRRGVPGRPRPRVHRAQPLQPRHGRARHPAVPRLERRVGRPRRAGCEAIEALKDEGKIRFFGVSINDHQPANAIKLIETGVVDTVQVIYNVFDQAPEDELLAACERTTSA